MRQIKSILLYKYSRCEGDAKMKKLVALILSFTLLIILSINAVIKFNLDAAYVDSNLINRLSSNIPNYTTIDKMPANLKNAVISVEDRRFYKHHGIDFLSIARAVCSDIKAGRIKEGGSTITQQLAKNLFLSSDRTFTRKIKELFYTINLERQYSKDQILEMYLNVIYYGNNIYGVQNASQKYFHKDLKKLTLNEAAMLAGIPQAPNMYSPDKHPDKAHKRQNIVLNAMKRNGFISERYLSTAKIN